MTALLLCLGTLVVVGIFMVVRAAFSAPIGYQDKNGFHLSNPGEQASPAAGRTDGVFPAGELLLR